MMQRYTFFLTCRFSAVFFYLLHVFFCVVSVFGGREMYRRMAYSMQKLRNARCKHDSSTLEARNRQGIKPRTFFRELCVEQRGIICEKISRLRSWVGRSASALR